MAGQSPGPPPSSSASRARSTLAAWGLSRARSSSIARARTPPEVEASCPRSVPILSAESSTGNCAPAAALWKELAPNAPWGPGRVTAAIDAPAGRAAAWQPDPASERLLAATVYYADLGGRTLARIRADAAAARADAGPDKGPMPGPVDGRQLTDATQRWVTQLARLARDDPNAPRFAARIDQLLAEHNRRTAACRTPLQTASVCFSTAGGLLEVLVMAADTSAPTAELLDRIRRARAAGQAGAANVLGEMRDNIYYNLALLSLLRTKGP